jgi:hypothetical protein
LGAGDWAFESLLPDEAGVCRAHDGLHNRSRGFESFHPCELPNHYRALVAYKDPHDARLLQKRRAHYHANKQQYLDRNVVAKVALIRWYQQLKSGPCTDCGQTYPHYVMDWDHVGEGKEINLAGALRKGWGKKRILAEIAKCELVCSNCHRIRTWTRRHELADRA